ncbi:unnamed protein product [Ectocarpus sp. 4 AP-2014]
MCFFSLRKSVEDFEVMFLFFSGFYGTVLQHVALFLVTYVCCCPAWSAISHHVVVAAESFPSHSRSAADRTKTGRLIEMSAFDAGRSWVVFYGWLFSSPVDKVHCCQGTRL